MLSAILGDNLGRSFGVAPLSEQTPDERAWSPLPQPDGKLIQDPDFVLPTTAGPLPWSLFYYPDISDVESEWGFGRRASWPIRLCALTSTCATYAYLEHEDGLGVEYINTGGPIWTPVTPRCFDILTYNMDGTWDETRFDTGATFHYPAGLYVTLAYYQSVHGRRVTMNYNSSQLLSSIQDPAGRTINYSYGPGISVSHVYSVQDWANRVRTLSYNVNGELSSIQDPTGAVSTFLYDGNHRLTSIQNPSNYFTTFTYDTDNRVTARSVQGHYRQYQYVDGPGNGTNTVYTDPLGKLWTTTLDQFGNVIQVTDPVGANRYADYNSQGLPVNLTDGINRLTVLEYDKNGRETLRQDQMGLDLGYWEARTYDSYGNLLTDANGLGQVYTYSYGTDPSKRLVQSEQDPLGNTTQYGYTDWGALKFIQTPMGFTTTYNWDNNGVMTWEQNALGYYRTYVYDAAGNRTSEQDELGKTTLNTYDGMSRLTSVKNPIGAIRTTIYDGVGNVQVEVNPLGYRTTYAYNEWAKETARLDARGYRWTTAYDGKGRETSKTDPNGSFTQSIPDVADRVVAQVDGMGRITTTMYDDARQPYATMDPAGILYYTNFDDAGRAYQQIAPDGNITQSVYDNANRLIATVEPTGVTHTINYDAVGRVWSLQDPTGAFTTTTYDANGRARSTVDGFGRIATSNYDAVGQLTLSIDPSGRLFTTVYDPRGLRQFEYSPDGTAVQRIYDDAGRNYVNIDYLGWRTTTNFDAADQVRSFQDQIGNIVTDDYDPVGQAYLTTDELGKQYLTGFDPGRRPTQYLDSTGNRTTTSFDGANAVTQFLDQLSDSEAYYYDFAGRFQSVQNAQGAFSTLVYDPSFGRLKSQIDELGFRTSLLYDGFGRWAATQDASGSIYTSNFDSFGRVVGTTNALGYATTTVYDFLDRPIAEMDYFGNFATVTYDNLNRVIGRQNQLGYQNTTIYDFQGNVRAEIDARNFLTTYGYDQYSRRIFVQNALGNVTTTNYDLYGRYLSTQNARGYSTTTFYDNYGRLSAIQDFQGNRTTTNYDIYGRVQGSQDALGNLTTLVYDALWRVKAEQDALGNFTTTVYDSVGRHIATQDARGYLTSFNYDAAGRMTARQDATNNIFTTVYDTIGRPICQQDPLGFRETTVYDAIGQAKARIDALGYITTTIFDPLGRAQTTWDALDRRTTTVYDAASQAIARQDAIGIFVTSVYDPVGNRTVEVNGLGYRTSWTYDGIRERVSRQDPLGRVWTYGFDPVGSLLTQQDAKGQVTTHSYDYRNLENGRQYADGTRVTLGYDALGRLTHTYDAAGRWTMTYDAMSRLRTVNGPGHPSGWPFTNSYDQVGNRTKLDTYFGAFTYTYEARNLVNSLFDPGYSPAGTPAGLTTWTYDTRGLLQRQDDRNQAWTTVTYDANGRTLQINHRIASAPTLERAYYQYDSVGRPLYKDTVTSCYTYSYDLVDRLKTEYNSNGLTTWTYDAAGRRIGQLFGTQITTYSLDAADQLNNSITTNVYTTYTYDQNGSVTLRQAYPNTRTTFNWDAANRLSSVALPTAGRRLTFAYKQNDLRHSKNSFNGPEVFLWDGNDVRAWLSNGNRPTQVYAQGENLTRALGTKTGGTAITRQYLLDILGTDERVIMDNQVTENAYTIDAFGNPYGNFTAAADNPYLFLGGLGYWYDPDLAMDYVRARWLDPVNGRWLSVDPVETESRYSYVRNSPTVFVDPSGEQSEALLHHQSAPLTSADFRRMAEYYSKFEPIIYTSEQQRRDWINFWQWLVSPIGKAAQLLEEGEKWLLDEVEYLWRHFIEWEAGILRDIYAKIGIAPPGEAALRASLPLLAPGNAAFTAFDPNGVEFMGGLVAGVLRNVVEFFIDIPIDVLKVVHSLLARPGRILSDIGKAVSEFVQNVGSLLGDFENLAPYDQGKITGLLIVSVLGLAAAGKGALLALRNLPKALASAKRAIHELVDTVREGLENAKVKLKPKAAREDLYRRSWEQLVDAYKNAETFEVLTKDQLLIISKRLRPAAESYGTDIRIHGSRAKGTARATSDIDIAIRVSTSRFQEILGRYGTPAGGSAKEREMLHAIATGKIPRRRLGLSGFGDALGKEIGISEVQISVIRIGGEFDRGPWIKVP